MLRKLFIFTAALLALFVEQTFAKNVLVFSKVEEGAYRHTSIPFGIDAIRALAKER